MIKVVLAFVNLNSRITMAFRILFGRNRRFLLFSFTKENADKITTPEHKNRGVDYQLEAVAMHDYEIAVFIRTLSRTAEYRDKNVAQLKEDFAEYKAAIHATDKT